MVETLYWVGCMATYRLPEVAKATDKILDTAGIDYSTLGNEEDCCGSVLLRIGMKQEAKMLARKNIEKIESMDVKRVVTSCTGCGKCFEFCPVRLDIPSLIEKMRNKANSMGFLIPPWRKIIENVEKYGNPFGEQKEKRSDWMFDKK